MYAWFTYTQLDRLSPIGLTSLGLAFRLAVTSLALVLRPTTCPRLPSVIRRPCIRPSTTSQKLGSDGASASDHLPETLLTHNLKQATMNALAGIAQLDHLRGGEVWDLTPFGWI